MKGFFSIRAKFLSVMSSLLIGCLVVYLIVAVRVFKDDKTELVFDLSKSLVSNISTELETEFSGVADKFRLYALLAIHPTNKLITENIFANNADVVFASLYRQDQAQPMKTFVDKKYLETYGLDSSFFEKSLPSERAIPFAEILKNGEHFWNASIPNGTPLIGYGRNVIIEDSKGIPTDHLAVVGYIKPDKVLKILSFVRHSEISIVDQAGNLLIQKDAKAVNTVKSFKDNPLFKSALDSKVNLSVSSFQDSEGEFLGAYSKAYSGKIYVLGRADKDQAFSAVYQLVSRSLSFALIFITLSLLFAFLLSRSLTQPISILVDGMEKVSGGDLTTKIEVKSKDETQLLATSFNQMIQELRQSRDELQEINRELDKKVKERTLQLEIQNQAVKDAQEALLKTTRLASAGEIAGRAAHEVLNPLTGILTRVSSIERKVQTQILPQVDLMKDIFQSWKNDHASGGFETLTQAWRQPSQVDPQWTLWQEDIHNLEHVQKSFDDLVKAMDSDAKFLLQEGGRINKIINGMRKLSHLKSDVKTYSVSKLLTDCRNIMADLFSQKNVEIIEEFNVAFDKVDLDRDEFIQAVTNLMRNSLQAMDRRDSDQKYFLKLRTYEQDGKVIADIVDNGSGVPEQYQPMLFEKQFTTKSADEGTGLGLGISRRFIRAHGGDIEFVSSDSYKETIFRISLPIKVSDIKEGAA